MYVSGPELGEFITPDGLPPRFVVAAPTVEIVGDEGMLRKNRALWGGITLPNDREIQRAAASAIRLEKLPKEGDGQEQDVTLRVLNQLYVGRRAPIIGRLGVYQLFDRIYFDRSEV